MAFGCGAIVGHNVKGLFCSVRQDDFADGKEGRQFAVSSIAKRPVRLIVIVVRVNHDPDKAAVGKAHVRLLNNFSLIDDVFVFDERQMSVHLFDRQFWFCADCQLESKFVRIRLIAKVEVSMQLS